jgi:HlyD family secretion protein
MHRGSLKALWAIAAVAGGLVVMLAAGGCGGRKPKGNSGKAPGAAEAIPVRVAGVKRGDIARTIEVTGSLEAENSTMVASKVAGRVASVLVDEGDHVAAGQALVVLDDQDIRTQVTQAEAGLHVAEARLAQATASQDVTKTKVETDLQQARDGQTQAQARRDLVRQGARAEERRQAEEAVNAARAGYDKAKADYDRAAKLVAEGAISKQMFDGAKAQYEAAESQLHTAEQALLMIQTGARPEELAAAEAALSQAQQGVRLAEKARDVQLKLAEEDIKTAEAGVAQAKAAATFARQQLADTVISAPYGGAIAQKDVGVGQVITPGVPFMRIVGKGQFSFVAQLSEKDYRAVAAGQEVSVTVDALPGRTFPGRVMSIVPSANKASRSFEVRIGFQDSRGAIRDGMFARGRLLAESRTKTLLIPSIALIETEGRFHVFVVKAGTVSERDVTLGIVNRDDVEVLDGLAEGDQVVVTGQTAVKDGAKVRITE